MSIQPTPLRTLSAPPSSAPPRSRSPAARTRRDRLPGGRDCTPVDDGLTTFTEGTLTVGVPENPPYTQTSGSSASGLEIDVVEKLAAAECLKLAYVPITYGNGIPMISEQKKTDIITGGWYVTQARAEKVGFTTPTYFDSMAIVSKEGLTTVEGLEDVGAVASGAGFSWEADMTQVLGGDLKTYPGTIEMKRTSPTAGSRLLWTGTP